MNQKLKLISLLLILSVDTLAVLSQQRLNRLSGNKKSGEFDQQSWDTRYSRPSFIFGKAPVKFLAENYEYIPKKGTVLDMGMGEGRNAVFLAQKGFKVTGVDISSVAVRKSEKLAEENGVKIHTVIASLDEYSIPNDSFDAIMGFYYLDRSLIKKMMGWLKPGGVIIIEAYTKEQLNTRGHVKDSADQYLDSQELLLWFKRFKVLKYEEPNHEKKYRASIIVQKPR